MLALLYLVLMFILGDAICRRFYPYLSKAHRWATAFLCGLMISSWWTYLSAAVLFGTTASPMLWGNLVFFITAIATIFWLRRHPREAEPLTSIDRATTEFGQWDWIFVGVFFVVAVWMMFGTLQVSGNDLEIGHQQFPDFGSTLSIMQSFALGHNFPTMYPHFTGEHIRYHFLFYFQAGNLEYLGFNPALANNVLSIFSLVSLLIVVMTMGAALFGSRVVGRIGAVLFFFHGSLSFYPFLSSQTSISDLWAKLSTMTSFLKSGLPYRGEDWGVWSQVVFLNQRHFASAIGIFFLILIFLIQRYREAPVRLPKPKKVPEVRPKEAADEFALSSDDDILDLNEGTNDPLAGGEIHSPAEGAPSVELEEEIDLLAWETPPNAEDEPAKDIHTSASESTRSDDDTQKFVTRRTEKEETDDTDTADENADEEFEKQEHEIGAARVEDGGATDEKVDDYDRNIEPAAPTPVNWLGVSRSTVHGLIFSGVLLGLLPLWNGAVFTAAFVVLAIMFLLFPIRKQMIIMGIVTAVIAIPQLIYLKTGDTSADPYPMFHWGYTIDDPTPYNVAYYLLYTFGFKWLLILVALFFASRLQRRFLAAMCGLIALALCVKFSVETLAPHKFFNVWLVAANLFVAYGLVRLWKLKIGGSVIPMRIVAVILAILVTIGGAIDLFPIKNSFYLSVKYKDDPLIDWIKTNTDPSAIFLSHRYINHGILLAGRRMFYGDPYYAWGAGYDTVARDKLYRQMLESKDVEEVYRILKENNISYVAIDNLIRKGQGSIRNPNESVYAAYFPLVFTDDGHQYEDLKIYKVPETLSYTPQAGETPKEKEPEPPKEAPPSANVFTTREGNTLGLLAAPRGIAVDSSGNIYVADTGNGRIQKFDADGKFLSAFGSTEAAGGELKEPNGIAIGPDGAVWVTDAVHHKLVKFDKEGTFVKEYRPDDGFYGPRDVAFGPNQKLYIVDQGLVRIARFDPATERFDLIWGEHGTGPGQFNEATGIAISSDGLVFVADSGNNRIQVFDLEGKFVRQWPTWETEHGQFPDVAFDDQLKRVYASNGQTNQIFAFDASGTMIGPLQLQGEDKLDNPTGLVISESNKKRRLLVLNTGGAKVTAINLETPKKGK